MKRAIPAVLAVLLLLGGALPRWWFHGTDDTLSIDFGLWDTRGCTARGCSSVGYEPTWIDNGWRSRDDVAHLERMVTAARVTFFAALALALVVVASLLLRHRALTVVSLALAATVVLASIVVLTHRPTFPDPDMRYFSMRTGLGGGITIAGAALAALLAAFTARRSDA